jgi:hypothetical protein
VILNPFDERSARWDLFAEIEKPYDVEQLARSLISEGADDASREWCADGATGWPAGRAIEGNPALVGLGSSDRLH